MFTGEKSRQIKEIPKKIGIIMAEQRNSLFRLTAPIINKSRTYKTFQFEEQFKHKLKSRSYSVFRVIFFDSQKFLKCDVV